MAQLDLDGKKNLAARKMVSNKLFNVHQHTSLLPDKAIVRSEC